MEKIFLDTSGLYALKNENDHFHKTSINLYKKAGYSGEAIFVITNYVLCELLNLVNMRKKHEYAIECLEFIEKSSVIEIERISKDTEEEAGKIFKENPNKDYSYTDCTSFAFMKEHKIKKGIRF